MPCLCHSALILVNHSAIIIDDLQALTEAVLRTYIELLFLNPDQLPQADIASEIE